MLQKGRVVMSVMLDYAPDDIALIQEQAKASNTSVEEFIRQASLNAARNAAYLAKLDRSREEFQQGKIVAFTDEEWEKYINAQDIQ